MTGEPGKQITGINDLHIKDDCDTYDNKLKVYHF